jgi:gluconokinase
MGHHDTAVLGVDLGTTNAKAAAYGLDGERLAHHDVEVPLAAVDDDRAEQDPTRFLAAAVQVLAAVTADLRRQGRRVAGWASAARCIRCWRSTAPGGR